MAIEISEGGQQMICDECQPCPENKSRNNSFNIPIWLLSISLLKSSRQWHFFSPPRQIVSVLRYCHCFSFLHNSHFRILNLLLSSIQPTWRKISAVTHLKRSILSFLALSLVWRQNPLSFPWKLRLLDFWRFSLLFSGFSSWEGHS